MQISNREKGNIGEDIAVKYLKENNYKIKKRNFRYSRISEIDIVAEKNDCLVFVEVKSRQSSKYGDPILSITPNKQRAIRKAASAYLYVNNINDQECRFDVIIIDVKPNPPMIDHLENAF